MREREIITGSVRLRSTQIRMPCLIDGTREIVVYIINIIERINSW